MALKTAAAKAAPKTSPKPASKPAKTGTAPATPAEAAPPTPAAATVTLKHLVAKLADTHAMPRKQAETVLDDVIGLLVAHLKAGDRLRIGGLGILEAKSRPARAGRNPATGAAIQIAASRKIAFRPAKELKAAV